MKHHENDLSQFIQNSYEMKLLDKRIIIISEGIDSSVAKKVITQLLYLDSVDSKSPIHVYINSPGGEINSGFAIYDTIKFIKPEVKIINTGLCASIATIINIAAHKQNRYSLPNCRFLIHQPLIPGQITGPAADLEITAKEILKTREKINKLLALECNQPLEKVEKDTARDYWMSAQEALEYGLITKIIENENQLE